MDMLASKIRAEGLEIKTIFHPAEIKGYVFIEGTLGNVQKAVQGVMHVRGLIQKPIRLEEIQQFLEYKKERVKVEIGDTIEIIGGPFKGEKGKVSRVDKVKGEVTVELLEATIPIPVTIATEFVKVIKPAAKVPEEEKPEAPPEEEKEEEEKPSELEKITEEE
ncbi:MAG: transcription elongation factor Spt5, partial [Candidatus Aminicenantales bacterium]